MKRPLVVVVLLYVGGIVLAKNFSAQWELLLCVSLGLAAAALLWKKARLIFLGALLVLAGWTNSILQTAIISPHDLRAIVGDQTDLATVRGTLLETPSRRVYEHDDKETSRTMAQLNVTELR